MTNAFTIPKESSFLQKGSKSSFSAPAQTKKRPKKVNQIVLPGSSKTLAPKMQEKRT
jgi:hypothetical protein